MTREDAIDKGYLENRTVFLRPLPRPGKMISEPTHVGYFMWDGATKVFCLPLKKLTNAFANPFTDESEQKYFESVLNLDLNPNKRDNNFWKDFNVRITKDEKFMKYGMEFNLSDPMDALRYRVLKCWRGEEIALSEEDVNSFPFVKFVLSDQDYKEKKGKADMDTLAEVYTFFGTIKGSPKKMKEFLSVYLIEKRSPMNVPEDSQLDWLSLQIKKAIDEDKDTVLKLIRDEDYPIKLFIARGVTVGAIEKTGVNSYSLPGMGVKYNLPEFVGYMKQLKETTDDAYMKIKAQIEGPK